MNSFVVALVAFAVCGAADALFFGESIGLTAASAGNSAAFTGLLGGAATGSTLFVTGSGLLLGAGILGLKAVAVASVLANQGRGKRSTSDDNDLAFVAIAVTEPAACYKRFICDLATDAMPRSENDVIMSLFSKPTSTDSPKFEFSRAAALGKTLKNVQACELRYSCPLSGPQIQKLFN